jgi:hypothetical protein
MFILKITAMRTNAYNKRALYISFLLLLVAATGCKKYLEADVPKTEVLTSQVFSNDDNANAAIAGLYATIMNMQIFNGKITVLTGFSSDEITYFTSDVSFDLFQSNTLTPDNTDVQTLWSDFYKIIYGCNNIIENAQASTGMSTAFKQKITGEALFFRAFCHFYLVNLFGDVPLIVTTDVTKTAYAPRVSSDSVYAQIKSDLTVAMNTLPADYVIAGGERIRANKWAAAALLARVYLYTKDWANAEVMATAVISSGNYTLPASGDINNVFKKNNSETILQIRQTVGNTLEGGLFLGYYGYFGYFEHRMQPALVNSFDTADLRRVNWILTATYNNGGGNGTFSTPYKYKQASGSTTGDEYYMLLRLGEQYLIRAEARAQQDNINSAMEDINVIRNRAGLSNTTATDKTAALAVVEQERRTELFCEWGHRWFDLKRWPSLTAPSTRTRADDVLGALKSTWKTTAIVYPIPLTSRNNNPTLTQNDGYN